MSSLELFDYSGQQVRTVLIDGEPWFVAADVCAILGIAWLARRYGSARPAKAITDGQSP